MSTGVVSKTTSRATTAGLTWALVEELDDAALDRRLYGEPGAPSSNRAEPDPSVIHIELKRPGVTLELLHLEYLQEHPDGLQYTAYCDRYRKWRKRVGLSMRQNHRAGEKLFVDFSGKRPSVVDCDTGEIVAVELFVAVLGASSLTFAVATRSQTSPDWIAAHVAALEYFGGASEIFVPDQLRSAISKPSRNEPIIQRTYADLARHCGAIVIPARPGRARDKAKVEVAVQVAQRWILARIRNEAFYSLEELNSRIRELVDELNDRPRRKLGGLSRRQIFERLERAALRPLPADRFEYAEWKQCRVNVDYHVEIDRHFGAHQKRPGCARIDRPPLRAKIWR